LPAARIEPTPPSLDGANPAQALESCQMEFNRNQFLILGMVLLFLGLELKKVESITLNERVSRLINERLANAGGDSDGTIRPFLASVGPTPRRTIHPPEWLGYAFLSVGAVCTLHSLAMKKPGG
jgi:hypothetical protein